MKRITLIILFLITIFWIGNAQQKSSFGLYTERDVYVSGETLLAKIYAPNDNQARIVYLDLVNQHGKRITGASLEIRNNQADGFLVLPDSLSSGTYLVRTYEKHTAESLKVIHEIWISNRFDGLEKTGQMSRVSSTTSPQEKKTDLIRFEKIESEYPIKSKIDASVSIDESLLKELDGHLLISLAQDEPSYTPTTFEVRANKAGTGLIEKKGIIISGMVTDRKTLVPMPGIIVYLTILDSIPGFKYYKTNSDGRFYFMIDKNYGAVEAVIQCFSSTPLQRLKIKLDELFAASGTFPEFSKQPFSESFKANISRNIDAVTFQKVFAQEKLRIQTVPKKHDKAYPYYGKATQTVDPQLFIDLPDFTEISRELLPGVKFRNYNHEPYMRVMNIPMHNYFDDQPLLLIDGIPIRDLNLIKNMGSTDIDRVEINTTERYYGELRFPGVVAIYTTKAAYSQLPESDQFIRLTLETIQSRSTLVVPDTQESSVPDLRQVLYWNPDIEAAPDLVVKCNTSSVLGQYKMVVRGRLKDGTLIFAEKHFEVK